MNIDFGDNITDDNIWVLGLRIQVGRWLETLLNSKQNTTAVVRWKWKRNILCKKVKI